MALRGSDIATEMSERGGLRQELEDFFEHALQECSGHSELRELGAMVEAQRNAVQKPMRVAFVGKTNCGKSTMMNAFLGQDVAPTGNGELTFNVSWFVYGEKQKLLVHTIDGKVEEETFESITELTSRCEQKKELLERIRYIEVQCPNPLLKHFDLIDTPGLHSFYVKDSKNTQKLLTDAETRPHAVVFMFSGSLQVADVRELEEFHRNCGSLMSGLTAIGALTKVDEWENGLQDGERSIAQLRERHPETHRYFYMVLPVVGPAAFGAQTITEDERTTLRDLAKLPDARRTKLIRDVGVFCGKEYAEDPEVPTAERRNKLYARLGRFGIKSGLQIVGEGTEASEFSKQLLHETNVDRLRRIVQAHFGNRALLIKASSALAAIRELAFQIGEHGTGRAAEAARRIAGRIDSIVADELRFREFALLEAYYKGNLKLEEGEIKQLLDVTGENGLSCGERLGMGTEISLDELVRIANRRQRYWHEKGNEVFVKVEIQELARVLAESYAGIRDRVAEARDHRKAAESLLAYDA